MESHIVVDDNTPSAPGGRASEALIKYALANDGGAPLVLSDTKGSCSCSEFWLEDLDVAPGGSTTLWARVTRGSFDRAIWFSLQSNDPATPYLRLTGLVKGLLKPPYVRKSLPVVYFGSQARPGDGRELLVLTYEHENDGVEWIKGQHCNNPKVIIVRNSVTDGPLRDKGVIERRYHYTIRLADDIAIGQFGGVITLLDKSDESVTQAETGGTVVAPVFVIPPVVMIPKQRSENLQRSFLIRTTDDELKLEVQAPEQLPAGIVVHQTVGKERLCKFSVDVARDAVLAPELNLAMRTNHPDCPIVNISLQSFGQ